MRANHAVDIVDAAAMRREIVGALAANGTRHVLRESLRNMATKPMQVQACFAREGRAAFFALEHVAGNGKSRPQKRISIGVVGAESFFIQLVHFNQVSLEEFDVVGGESGAASAARPGTGVNVLGTDVRTKVAFGAENRRTFVASKRLLGIKGVIFLVVLLLIFVAGEQEMGHFLFFLLLFHFIVEVGFLLLEVLESGQSRAQHIEN